MTASHPFTPSKTYYLELNGKPSCVSDLHPMGRPVWSCAQSSHKEAQEEALMVWRDHPHCTIAIKEGSCPCYGDSSEWDDYEYE